MTSLTFSSSESSSTARSMIQLVCFQYDFYFIKLGKQETKRKIGYVHKLELQCL